MKRNRPNKPPEVFFGAAPGVGKTYEMLTAARAKKAEGVDFVVSVVETHGRKETEALLHASVTCVANVLARTL